MFQTGNKPRGNSWTFEWRQISPWQYQQLEENGVMPSKPWGKINSHLEFYIQPNYQPNISVE